MCWVLEVPTLPRSWFIEWIGYFTRLMIVPTDRAITWWLGSLGWLTPSAMGARMNSAERIITTLYDFLLRPD